MRKRLQEEITDLRIEINKYILPFILLFAVTVKCQVPINSFCKFNSFPAQKGMTGLFSFNFNNDAYSDLLLFSPNKTNLNVLEGVQSDIFKKFHSISSFIEPSVIQNIYDRNRHISGYAFASRKRERAGIIEFSSSGGMRIKSEIRLTSYPDNISASDINNNGEPELLVSGGAFDGLSILYYTNGRLKEKKIASGTVYSNSVFADISNDGIPDITAFDLLKLNIDLFYNTGKGDFRKLRSIQLNEPLKAMKLFDMNLDYYQDIIVSYGKSIDIYSGSFNSDFTLSQSIATYYSPDKIITADLNSDGKIDIAYVDTTAGVFSVFYSSGKNGFYNEIVYLQKKGIKDLIPLYSKFITGVAMADENGFVYTVTNMRSVSGENLIIPAADPSVINYFNSDNFDNIKDICFIDKGDTRLKLFIRNGAGVPYKYNEFDLNSCYENLLTQYLGDETNFILYDKWKNLLSSVKVNFKSNTSSRKYYYSPGNILDVVVSEKNRLVYVGSYDNENLYLSVLDENLKKISVYSCRTGSGLNDARVYPGKNISLWFWQYKGESLTLYNTSLTNNLENPVKQQNPPKDYVKNYVRDYFVNRMNLRNYQIISINKENKCISIKQAL